MARTSGRKPTFAANHQNRRHETVEPHPLAGQQADRGRAPEGRRGVEAAHIEALLEDHASPEKADAGHDLGRDPRRAVMVPGGAP